MDPAINLYNQFRGFTVKIGYEPVAQLTIGMFLKRAGA